MPRTVLAVVAGFFTWVIIWVGIEKILSAISPLGYGAHQSAFQAAVENRVDASAFTADTTMLVTHIVVGSIVSVIAGYLAALVARHNKRAPLILGFLLLGLGLLKLIMSWPYVPIWYHIIFTAILLPMAVMGGKLKTIE
jgi:hypothetical protein